MKIRSISEIRWRKIQVIKLIWLNVTILKSNLILRNALSMSMWLRSRKFNQTQIQSGWQVSEIPDWHKKQAIIKYIEYKVPKLENIPVTKVWFICGTGGLSTWIHCPTGQSISFDQILCSLSNPLIIMWSRGFIEERKIMSQKGIISTGNPGLKKISFHPPNPAEY